MQLCFVIKAHLQGSTDFHHVILLYYSNSEVVCLHELLQESPVVFILTPWKWEKNNLVIFRRVVGITTI